MVPNVAMVVMVAMVTTVAKVIMVAVVKMANLNDIGLKEDVQMKAWGYHSKEECLIMQTNADKCWQMEANDDKRGDQVGFGGFVRATEGI